MLLKAFIFLSISAIAYSALFATTTSHPTPFIRGGRPMAGGFTIVDQPEGQLFQYALNKVLSEHPQLSRQSLEKVESQVVSGINYRFTFKGQNGQPLQYTTYVPLSQFPERNEHKKTQQETPNVKVQKNTDIENGCKDILKQPYLYRQVESMIKQRNSWTNKFQVIEAQQCTNTQYSKRLVLRDKENGQYATFTVSQKPNQKPKVTLKQYLHASGHSRVEIQDKLKELMKKLPALNSFRLVEAWNALLRREESGEQIVLKLEKEDRVITVFCFTYKNIPWIAVYGL